MTAAQTTEVVKSVSIANMANQRAAIIARLDQALGLLREAEKIAKSAKLGWPTIEINRSHLVANKTSITDEADAFEMIRRTVDYYGWDHLMKESGLLTFMDATARQEWNRQLSEGKSPDFTIANIEATFSAIHSNRGDMFERGIVNCFQNLSWNFATNQPFKFGKRIILKRLCDRVFGTPHYEKVDELEDLARVFFVLDGKPEPDNRAGCGAAIDAAKKAGESVVENDYFIVKWFKNGNGHVEFKRPDLVTQMNRIIAKHYPNALATEVR